MAEARFYKLKPSQYSRLCQLKMNQEEVTRCLRILWAGIKSEKEMDTLEKHVFTPNLQKNGEWSFPFVPSPPVFVLRAREINSIDVKPISFRNDDTTPYGISIAPLQHPSFKIINPINYRQKVAPGMSLIFQLQFEVLTCDDYYTEIKCTANDKFMIIPVFGVGPRAYLDVPDTITFPPSPVKFIQTKTLIVRNIGEKNSRCTLTTLNKKVFSVRPEQCLIPINGTLQIEVDFYPLSEGEMNDELYIHYDSGEQVYLQISGTSENINIRLEKSSLHLYTTYLSLQSDRQIKLINGSDIPCHFKWSIYASREEENMRAGEYLIENVDNEESPSKAIHIEPVEGDVWQKTSQICTVVFSPQEACHYEMVYYCDVVGRDTRLPLKIIGDGKGPTIKFVTSKVDVGKILVGIQKYYEVVIKNDGLIPATFRLVPAKSLFGRYFKFIPEADCIQPNKSLVINVTIQCPMLGDFYEEFVFNVEKNRVPLKLIINGSCIGPTLAFESRKISLGCVAYGYPTTKTITLENKSLIPVHFHLRIIEDNAETSTLSDSDTKKFENAFLFETILGKSNEIKLKPETSNVDPMSSTEIELTLTARSVKTYKYFLVVDVQGVGKAVTSVSISAKSLIPKLNLVDNTIVFDRCFLDFPYEQEIRLRNDSVVPAIYRIKPQPTSIDSLTTIKYESAKPEGVVKPQSCCSIPVTIIPKTIGVLQEVLNISVTGYTGTQISVPIKCTSCGPVVDVQPEFMDWGLIPVLQLTSKTIQIINLSPIRARFVASMVNLNSVWKLDPISGNVQPNSTIDITINAYFQDTQKFQDKVIIKIMHSVTYQIPVWVKTFGTTIGIEPPISNPLILPPHFSNVLLEKRFIVINHGRKSQQLYWSSESVKHDKSCGGSTDNTSCTSLFHLIPNVMELSPGQSMDFTLQALSDRPQKVTELFTCYGTKGRTKNKEMVMQFEVITEFIAPSLLYSTTELTFKVYKEKNKDLDNVVTPLIVTNVSALPLTVSVEVKYPFQVLLDGIVFATRSEVIIPIGHKADILINFNPNYVNDKVMRSVKEELIVSFLEHPQVDKIPLTGYVYFANLLFDETEAIFDIVPVGLEWRKTLTMSNTSPFQVYYEWHTFVTVFEIAQMSSTSECRKFLSIVPTQGVLHPGDNQEVTFLFNAETKVKLEGVAVCEVDDGPNYPVKFYAQAADLAFDLYPRIVTVGNQVFNEIINVKLTLANNGDVGFNFSGCVYPIVLNRMEDQQINESVHFTNFALLIPNEGFVAAHETLVLMIKILPAYPWNFKYEVWLDIAHFDPSLVTVVGHSVFPFVGVSVDEGLPNPNLHLLDSLIDLQTGVRLMKDVVTCIKACLQDLKQMQFESEMQDLRTIKNILSHCFDSYKFAELVVDFGFVILGSIISKTICVFNRSNLPISFKLEVEKLNHAGFYVDIDQVKHLPPLNSVSFRLTFNPFNANVPLGEHTLHTFIKISNSIPSCLRLRAVVTKPNMKLSTELIEFGGVQCSYCKVITIQLHNDGFVPCEWECVLKKTKFPKARKSKHHGILNPVFNVRPSNGFLRPKDKMNIEFLFIPHDDKFYTEKITFKLRKSNAIPFVVVKGTGVDPNIILRPQILIFDPVLPDSTGCEKEVIIENPCNFPIELYSVEFDSQYKVEDTYLRLLPDYDEYDSLLIPVRQPGESLPVEFYKYFSRILPAVKTFLNTIFASFSSRQPKSPDGVSSDIELEAVASVKSLNEETDAIDDCNFTEEEKSFIFNMYDTLQTNEKLLLELSSETQENLISLVYKFYSEMFAMGLQDELINPVRTAMNNYVNPIKFPNGMMEESSNYLTVIIFCPPYSDLLSNEIASEVANTYKTKVNTLDNLVQEAIVSGKTSSALTAREYCRKKATEMKSRMMKQVSRVQKDGSVIVLSMFQDEGVSTKSSSIKFGEVGDEELYSAVLPTSTLTEVITDKIQESTYETGLIVAGLDCIFSANIKETISALMNAFSTKKHLYFVSLHKTFSSIKENAEKNKLDEIMQSKMKLKNKVQRVENMSEEEYDALKAEERADVDRIIGLMKEEWLTNKKGMTREKRASTVADKLKTRKSMMDRMNIKVDKLEEASATIPSDEQTMIKIFTDYQKDFDTLITALETYNAVKEESKEPTSSESDKASPRDASSESKESEPHRPEEKKVTPGFPHLIVNISALRDTRTLLEVILATLPNEEELKRELEIIRSNMYCPPPYFLSVLVYPFRTRKPTPSQRFDFVGSAIITDKLGSDVSNESTEFREIPLITQKSRSDVLIQQHKKPTRRWLIPARSQMSIRIRFQSTDMGQFDRILHFELLGCRRQYQLFCRGVCRLPDIRREPSVLFRIVKKAKKENEIVEKAFIMETKTFEFGPLLTVKSEIFSDTVKGQNSTTWNIVNTSGMYVSVSFELSVGKIFQVEPTTMSIEHGQEEKLNISALPTEEGLFEDEIIVQVKDNPDPLRVQVSCVGSNPTINVEPREIYFGRVLLHRREFQNLKLVNVSLLPLIWKLNIMDCGDEFIFPVFGGFLLPNSVTDIKIGFQSSIPLVSTSYINIDVFDTNYNVGLLQTEVLTLTGEAYDVMVDMTFPKGCQENVIDFGYIRVKEECKLNILLKNRGKYDVWYKFAILPKTTDLPDPHKLLSIVPSEGKMFSHDRGLANVQFTAKCKREVSITEVPFVICRLIEYNMQSNHEGIVAEIPIKITLKALYCKFKIRPEMGVNFGSILVGNSVMQSFYIINLGPFNFTFDLLPSDSNNAVTQLLPKPPSGFASSNHNLSYREKLFMDKFTINPSTGTVNVGQEITINVDCNTQTPGKFKTNVVVRIANTSQDTSYPISAEVSIPIFECGNISSIFEEHHICRNQEEARELLKTDIVGVFCKSESLFLFKDTLLDTSVEAHVKIYNNGKVPCDIVATLTPVKKHENIATSFSVHPSQSTILPFTQIFLSVVFNPKQLQKYEAVMQVGLASVWSEKDDSSISFNLCGEGVLPLITITKPVSQSDEFCLTFMQLLVGETQELQFEIKNISAVPCTVTMELFDPSGVFWIPTTNTDLRIATSDEILIEKDHEESALSLPTHVDEIAPEKGLTFMLLSNQEMEFSVFFAPKTSKKYSASMLFDVWGNYFEKPNLILTGEGCDAELLIKVQNPHDFEEDEKESVCWKQPKRFNFLDLGQCHVNETYKRNITMINKSSSIARFEWQQNDLLNFSPQIAHVKDGSQKDVVVTFFCDKPMDATEQIIECSIAKINLGDIKFEGEYWDDRKKIVKWVKVSIEQIEDPDNADKPKEYIDKKKIVTEPEPEYVVVPGSEGKLDLYVHVQTAYCSYSLDTKILHFENTYVYDLRTLNVCMMNTGKITLNGRWFVRMRISHKSDIDIPSLYAYSTEYLGSSDVPISISPSQILIKEGSQQIFQVKFSPTIVDTFEGSIKAIISNLMPDLSEPKVKIQARSLLPYCHFKLESSDYVTANRRDRHLPIPTGIVLDNSIKVVEITASGIGVESKKSFTISNPTNADYTFHWQRVDSRVDDFSCLTPAGSLHAGSSSQITFQLRSHSIGVTESFWKFLLPSVNLAVPFLLVGIVKEPEVFASCSAITIGPLLKGQNYESGFELLNHDDCRMDFTFDPDSCFTPGRQMHLQLHPMSGAIPPNSRNRIRIYFRALTTGKFNFNLLCSLPKRSTPIKINVKVTVYEMKVMVYYTSINEQRVELQPNKTSKLDLGRINVGEFLSTSVVVVNSGDVGFEFKWLKNVRCNQTSDIIASVFPEVGYVRINDSEMCTLSVKPNIEGKVRSEFKLKIIEGPWYAISVSGEGEMPGLSFSTSFVDFGHCFANISSQERTVFVTNTHRKSLSIQCLYSQSGSLTVQFGTSVLAPQETKSIVLVFIPRAIKLYEEKVQFLINSSITKLITVIGEGIELKVTVSNFHDKFIKFGSLRIGDVKKKTITVVNSSKAPVERPGFQLDLDNENSDLRECLSLGGKCVLMLEEMRGQCSIDIIFAPKRRVANFKCGLMFTSGVVRLPISTIFGCCKALEVSLLDSVILFGAVVENATVERKLLMINTGDYGTRFHWDEFKFFPDFSINPTSGYITPDSQVSFTVFFQPTKMSAEIKREGLKCYLEQGHQLSLNLVGSCIEIPANAKVLNFSTPVRKTDRQEISITNDTSQVWKVQPKVNGEFWEMAPVLQIGPNETKEFDIIYHPLSMTRDQTHQGSVFIIFPNGNHMAYNFIGHSFAPTSTANITRDIQCRTEYVELLTLDNWFPMSQRFKVIIDTQEKLDASTFIQGISFIDVMGRKKKDYKLKFLAYRELTLPFRVTFLSEETGEYEFYEMVYKTYKAGPEEMLQLTSPMRTTLRRDIVVKNPLKESVTFSVSCDHREIQLPSSFVIEPESDGRITVEFTPLHVGEEFSVIELNSHDLGLFEYEVVTKCKHLAPEKTVHVTTFIGTACSTTVRLPNPFPDAKYELTVKIDNADVYVEKSTVAVNPGAPDIIFDLIFDPSTIGEIQANITLTSLTTGDFLIPVLGKSVPPKAQGPVVIKTGTPLLVTIRNPFAFTLILENRIENAQFTVGSFVDVVKSHKDVKIPIHFDPSPTTTETTPGKIIINGVREDTGVVAISWTYYVHGFK